jgi:hypothetical protein
MSPGNRYECLTEVMLAVEKDLNAFDEALKNVQDCLYPLLPERVLAPLSKRGRVLYLDYRTGQFSGKSFIRWGTMIDIEKSRSKVLKYFGRLSDGYHQLIDFLQIIGSKARIPDYLVAPEDTNNPDNLLGDIPMSNKPLR